MSKQLKSTTRAWTAWVLTIAPMGLAIANKDNMALFLSLMGLTAVINLALVAFVLRRTA